MSEMDKPASRVEAILQRMLGSETNIEKPASRVEFLLANVKDLLLAVEDEVEKLEGKTTRLLYSDKTNPTAQEIDAFAIEKGYENPYEGVAIVVSGTYHIWHFYENDNIGWKDDGVDTITPFTIELPGSILGSEEEGKIFANLDGTGSVNGWNAIPVVHGDGRSSIITKTVNESGDVDRTNIAEGKFSGAFGSRIHIGPKASESFGFGGLIEIYGQNALNFGYRVISRANQSLSGGYRCTNNASESIQVGTRLIMDGTITEDEDGNPTSNSRNNAQFGQSCTMGTNTVNCLMSGEGHTQGHSAKWNAVIGKTHTLGHHNECVNSLGASNITHDYLTDSTLIGYDHEAFGGTSTSHIKYDIYMFGHNSTNRDANGTAHSNVYFIGRYLRPTEDDQLIVGAYNAGVANCWFEVGCGNSSARATAFAVCQQGNNRWIKVGNASLTESDVADNATKTFVNGIVGNINTVLDAINGTVI